VMALFVSLVLRSSWRSFSLVPCRPACDSEYPLCHYAVAILAQALLAVVGCSVSDRLLTPPNDYCRNAARGSPRDGARLCLGGDDAAYGPYRSGYGSGYGGAGCSGYGDAGGSGYGDAGYGSGYGDAGDSG